MTSIAASVLSFPLRDWTPPIYCGLDIDLGAIAHNYRTLKAYGQGALVSAVLKADAYGLGAARISKALYKEGCRHFFTAYLEEAIDLRENGDLPRDAAVYVLNGYFKGTESAFIHYGLTPVLTDIEKIQQFSEFAKQYQGDASDLTAALHIDSGMNRTGIRPDALMNDENLQEILRSLSITLVLTQLANASEKGNPFNAVQRNTFVKAVESLNLPKKPLLSFANSGGVFLGHDFHFDVLRPGLALYTNLKKESDGNDHLSFKEAVTLWAKIYQVQTVKKGETIGYSQTYTLDRDRKIATLSIGYADGYTWSITKETTGQAYAMLGEYKLPLLGRISMDLITVDVSDVPEHLLFEGQRVDLLNDKVTVHTHAEWTGLRIYEILLKFGKRIKRDYRD